MRHEYIVDYEVYSHGTLRSFGNQSITVTGDGPPSASEFLTSAKAEGERLAKFSPAEIRIVGIFKL